MIVCIAVYLLLLAALLANRKSRWLKKMATKEKRILFLTVLAGNLAATALFAAEWAARQEAGEMARNSYGGGSRVESYEATVEGELDAAPFDIEVQEREYTHVQIQEIFSGIMDRLDGIILGDNQSPDRVETDLNLVEHADGYPVDIRWETDHDELLDTKGVINEEETEEKGTLVQLRATLSYGEEEAVYVTHVRIYPKTKSEKEKWIDAVRKSVAEKEEETRTDREFALPETVDGKAVRWTKKKEPTGYLILGFSLLAGGLLIWKNRQDEKEKKQKRISQMMRDYPDIISKFTLLLGTGMTVKNAWQRIVQGYESEAAQAGGRAVYEEMSVACNEMKSGVPEAEAYERFGNRCEAAAYRKFGALLAQNLRKGGKGLSELLKLEAIQAFENRKSMARRMGEEAGTRLLTPMFGMLAVVMIMVLVPAFLSMQF